jgi:hypothetical protein
MTPLARILKPKYSKGTSNRIVNFMCEFSKGAPFQKPKPLARTLDGNDLDDNDELIVFTCGPGGIDCRAMRGKQEGGPAGRYVDHGDPVCCAALAGCGSLLAVAVVACRRRVSSYTYCGRGRFLSHRRFASFLSRCRQGLFANPVSRSLYLPGIVFWGRGVLSVRSVGRACGCCEPHTPGTGRRGSRVMTTSCAARDWNPFPAAFRQRPSGRALPAGFGCHGKGGGCTVSRRRQIRYDARSQGSGALSEVQDDSSSRGRYPGHSARLE